MQGKIIDAEWEELDVIVPSKKTNPPKVSWQASIIAYSLMPIIAWLIIKTISLLWSILC